MFLADRPYVLIILLACGAAACDSGRALSTDAADGGERSVSFAPPPKPDLDAVARDLFVYNAGGADIRDLVA